MRCLSSLRVNPPSKSFFFFLYVTKREIIGILGESVCGGGGGGVVGVVVQFVDL
jgi:hypothetical protein